MYPSYEVVRFRDSAKVLKDIQEITDRPLVDLTQTTVALSAGVLAARNRDTAELISEVLRNAPKAKDIIPAAAEPLRVDSRNYRSRQRDGQWSSERGSVIEQRLGGDDGRYDNPSGG